VPTTPKAAVSSRRSAASGDARAALQAWYLESLRPKLLRAAGDDVVARSAARELDRQLHDFLDLPRERVRLAAPADARLP
jgi:hypothetical protein